MRPRAADIVDPREFLCKRLLARDARTMRIDEAEWAAFLACAIVGCDERDRIRHHAGAPEKADKASEIAVRMVEHRRVGGLQSREDALFVGAMARPGLYAGIARWQSRRCRHDAHLLLPSKPAIALLVPAVPEDVIVALDQVERRLMRRVARAEGKPKQPGRIELLC